MPDPVIVDAAAPFYVRRPTRISIQLSVAGRYKVIWPKFVLVVRINSDWHPFVKQYLSTVSCSPCVTFGQKNEIAFDHLIEVDIENGNRVCWRSHLATIAQNPLRQLSNHLLKLALIEATPESVPHRRK